MSEEGIVPESPRDVAAEPEQQEEPEDPRFGEELSNSAADEFSLGEFEEEIPERVVNLPPPEEPHACLPRVMMVDDDAFNFIPLEAFLKKFKTEYDTFTCGETAIGAYEKSLEKTCCKMSYPLVITDINMPVVDGFQVGERIIALEEQQPDLPHSLTVLALTSHVDNDVRKRAAEIGFT